MLRIFDGTHLVPTLEVVYMYTYCICNVYWYINQVLANHLYRVPVITQKLLTGTGLPDKWKAEEKETCKNIMTGQMIDDAIY